MIVSYLVFLFGKDPIPSRRSRSQGHQCYPERHPCRTEKAGLETGISLNPIESLGQEMESRALFE
jgi:hypothetical protein